MCLDHVFLNDRCARHGMVQNCQIVVDRLWGNFLAQSLLKGLMCEVKSYDACSPDIIPFLLHRSIVDEVKIVTITYDICSRYCIWGQLSLTHRDTGKVKLGVICLQSSLLGDRCSALGHFYLSWVLCVSKSEVFGLLICYFAFRSGANLIGSPFFRVLCFH